MSDFDYLELVGDDGRVPASIIAAERAAHLATERELERDLTRLERDLQRRVERDLVIGLVVLAAACVITAAWPILLVPVLIAAVCGVGVGIAGAVTHRR